ncbi:MAG TPA: LCP family protein [Thermoleophilia bacterium]|nr:LCP family protein [Thermoleophilia bacterium]
MGQYRVYRVGEDEHVREVKSAAPTQLERRARRGGPAAAGSSSAPIRWWVWALIATAVAAGAGLYWFFGREAVSNSRAALDIAKLSGKVPDWAVLVAPVVVVAAVAVVTAYLAFGRRLAVKIIGVAAVVLVLAMPGLAVGYANGLVSGVGGGQTGSAATTPEEQSKIDKANQLVDRPVAHKPMNILLIGSDKSSVPGDPGRSDTQLLVRLDPDTKSISMLSLPRDLQVNIEGVGLNKMNAAYSYGGPALVIKTFKQLTGLPINGWIEINFAGFWHVVNILGGVYLPVDHRYFVPASADYKSINLQPGYQLVRGKQALNFVRFRHDQRGDFTRMQRQQLFIREVQHQSGRWSHDWTKVIKLIKAITKETESNFSSLKKLEPLVELAFRVNTSKVYQTHLEGSTPMINGVSYVTATSQEIADVVKQFTDPTTAPVSTKGQQVGKKQFTVHVYNGSGIDGLATSAASQLEAQGYNAVAEADAYEFPGTTTVIYAPKELESYASALESMLAPANVQLVTRGPGSTDGITVFVASSFDGTINIPQDVAQQQQTLEKNQKADWSTWKQYDAKTPIKLEAPTSWSSGFVYDQWRNYSIETTDGKQTAASVAVVETPQYGYWGIQAMRWQDPPEVQNPSSTQTIKGRKYMLFYQGDHLHLVAWREHGTLYWVVNTLDNQLSDDLMMGLATSCEPVK